MMTMRTLISKVNQINRSIAVINNRLSDIDYNLTETERNPVFASYNRSLLMESSSLWEQKNSLIDQKNILLEMIKAQRNEEEMIAKLLCEVLPETYELLHIDISGIHVVVSVKHSYQVRKEVNSMTDVEKEMRKKQIDSRVSRLEKINDDWISRNGEENSGIMQLINELMDERETLM